MTSPVCSAGRALQAKYMVRSVSWWICTALARACWSRPLLWPDVWLPSALGDGGGGRYHGDVTTMQSSKQNTEFGTARIQKWSPLVTTIYSHLAGDLSQKRLGVNRTVILKNQIVVKRKEKRSIGRLGILGFKPITFHLGS